MIAPSDITEHFKNFFNRPSPVSEQLPENVLQCFAQFPTATVEGLGAEVSVSEFCKAVQGMSTAANPGPYGLQVSAIKGLAQTPRLLSELVELFNKWLIDPSNDDLLDSTLTAIPKPGRDPGLPKNLRPIAVSSMWYRIAMRVFIGRISDDLPTVYSVE